jgi:hypothetical protein
MLNNDFTKICPFCFFTLSNAKATGSTLQCLNEKCLETGVTKFSILSLNNEIYYIKIDGYHLRSQNYKNITYTTYGGRAIKLNKIDIFVPLDIENPIESSRLIIKKLEALKNFQ